MCFAVYCRRSSITRFHRNGESTPPCGHPRLVLIRLVAFLCVMVTCRLVTMFLIQPAVDESRGDWSIASEMALKDTLSKGPYVEEGAQYISFFGYSLLNFVYDFVECCLG